MDFFSVLLGFFKLCIVLNAFLVINSVNPVHSVLFLVLVFINASALLFVLGTEFLAIMLLVVYVGAIAVLFLFVCMMLNVRFDSQNMLLAGYTPLGVIVVGCLILEFGFLLRSTFSQQIGEYLYIDWVRLFYSTGGVFALGSVLYTTFGVYFILSAFILLLSMIGAIALTLYHRRDVRRQVVFEQIQRNVRAVLKHS